MRHAPAGGWAARRCALEIGRRAWTEGRHHAGARGSGEPQSRRRVGACVCEDRSGGDAPWAGIGPDPGSLRGCGGCPVAAWVARIRRGRRRARWRGECSSATRIWRGLRSARWRGCAARWRKFGAAVLRACGEGLGARQFAGRPQLLAAFRAMMQLRFALGCVWRCSWVAAVCSGAASALVVLCAGEVVGDEWHPCSVLHPLDGGSVSSTLLWMRGRDGGGWRERNGLAAVVASFVGRGMAGRRCILEETNGVVFGCILLMGDE